MSLISGIHHVSMRACGQEAYKKVVVFYTEVLELPVKRSWGGGIMIDLGNGLLEIFNDGTEELPKGVITHFALATNDVEACVKRVQEAGYDCFIPPTDIAIPSDPILYAKMAFCHGPLGEEIEFFQEKG